MTNLLPHAEKKKIVQLYRLRYFSVALGLLALIAAASALVLAPSAYFLRSSKTVLGEKLAALTSAEIGTIAAKQAAAVRDINTRLNAFQPGLPASPIRAGLIDPTLAAKTPGVRITTFSYMSGKNATASVEIRGVATDRASLLAFADKLRTAPHFSNVTVPIENFIKGSNSTFAIQATIALK